jgi:hypothetical protein
MSSWEAEQEAERRELEAAGWESVERMGKIVWRNPVSGHLYPQSVAISMVREGAATDLPSEPEGDA